MAVPNPFFEDLALEHAFGNANPRLSGLVEAEADGTLDMHNNTGPHLSDAFRSTDPRILERFESVAPGRSRSQKVWATRQVTFPDDYLLNVCQQRFGTLPMLTEFPWYARLPEDMRDHGREFLTALLELITEAW